jgi:hypothetical protein
MVHALQVVHRLLRPQGVLINVHDIPIPHLIEVHSSGGVTRVGWITDKTDFGSERSAYQALTQAVENGNFMLEDEENYNLNIFLDDLNELQTWLAETWGSAVLPEKTRQRIELEMSNAGQQARLVIIIPARLTKLRAI